MNRTSPFASLLIVLLTAGCATGQKQFSSKAERDLSDRIGAPVQWMQSQSNIDEAQKTVQSLLANELTVGSAIQVALLNNRGLQAQLEEIGVSRADFIQAGRLRNPEFSASWRFPDRPPSAANTEYSLVTELVDLIFLPARKRFAALALEQTQLRVAGDLLKLAYEVEEAFYNIQADQQLLKRLSQINEVNEAASEMARRQHEAGNITDLNLANQQAAHSASTVALMQSERELRKDQQHFNRLLGLSDRVPVWKVSDQLPELPEREIPVDALETLALAQRKDLAALKSRVDGLTAALALKRKTRYLPANVHVGVDTERETDRTHVTGPTLSLDLPIFDQGQAAIARLEAETRQAQRTFEAFTIQVRSEVNQAVDEVTANRALALYLHSVVLPQYIQIANETLLHYNAMQKPSFDLLAARERALTVERQYVEAVRDYWIARSDLQRALGGKIDLTAIQPLPANEAKPVVHPEEHNH